MAKTNIQEISTPSSPLSPNLQISCPLKDSSHPFSRNFVTLQSKEGLSYFPTENNISSNRNNSATCEIIGKPTPHTTLDRSIDIRKLKVIGLG